VNTLFVSDIISEYRGRTKNGRKIYSLNDVYPHADLVTYPSTYEGFGNAFLEAVYFRKPIVINTYSIYHIDIDPKGFEVIEMDGYVTEEMIQKARDILNDPEACREMVEHNYRVGMEHYSYRVLHEKLRVLIADCLGATR
jgi:glycosyltransferase involved in cell wall biosynthesis